MLATKLTTKNLIKRFLSTSSKLKESNIIYSNSKPGIKSIYLQIKCETDFVSKSEYFKEFSQNLAKVAMEYEVTGQEKEEESTRGELTEVVKINEIKQNQNILELIKKAKEKTKEKIELGNCYSIFESKCKEGEFYTNYLHSKSKNGVILAKSGVLVKFKVEIGKESNLERDLQREEEFSNKIAQHVYGLKPSNVDELLDQSWLFGGEKRVCDVIDDFKVELNLLNFEVLGFMYL